ncbi:MAG: phosphate acyltransferase PlsX [Peptococcaceae bacterium]|nr:phosphate acyltransferase PlsX [Peptococcaceae bacterium]
MRIAVDAMGGDYAPSEVILGAAAAAREFDVEIVLVGDQQRIEAELPPETPISIVHASETVEMCDQAVVAVRKKKDASIVKAVRLLKEGEVEAVVSAGHTGATMAGALLNLGRIKGIDRPALVSCIPNREGVTVLLDVGANVDCRPRHLVQFGVMGTLYAEKVLGIENPRVGLLSIGEEPSKGNELTLAAYPLLEQAGFRFIGNVEGRDVFNGRVDVIVCDGFVGNIVLKTAEGLASAFKHLIKKSFTRNWMTKVSAPVSMLTFKDIGQRFDYSEYGGAPLLGVNGVVIVSHGSSRAKAVKNAVKVAKDAVEGHLVDSIARGISDLKKEGLTC